MAENGRVSTKQAAAVAALLAHRTVADAAQAAGVGARTLQRWLSDAAFRVELKRAQDAAVDAAVRRMVGGIGGALDVLSDVMADATVSPSVKVRAASVWLDTSASWAELRALTERVAALEEAQRAQSGESNS